MPLSQEQVYAEFQSYDWSTFAEFQEGLDEILRSHLESLKERDPSIKTIPAVERQQLTDQAKSFFFCSSTGHILNLDDYHAWERSNRAKITPLQDGENDATSTKKEVSDTPYSSNYQEVVELIVSGKPVPGIKDIPDTVLPERGSESRVEERLKPWEKSTI